jgi:hypothetical protein
LGLEPGWAGCALASLATELSSADYSHFRTEMILSIVLLVAIAMFYYEKNDMELQYIL